jgi:ParB family chromosome partitioning protein
MRHDAHYVEELSQHRPQQVGRMIPVDKLDPNPEQPRVEFGDLTELTASIAEKGVLEPLLVKPNRLTGRWMIIAGERRWRSAQRAGLKEVPCVEMEVDEGTVAEIALIENMQRKDLTVWEEADGLLSLCERFGYSHEADVREICMGGDINAKSSLLQIVRQPDDDSMRRLAKQIASQGLNRNDAREARRQDIGPRVVQDGKPLTYKYADPHKQFNLEIRFRQSKVADTDIAALLRSVADDIDAP